jgi:hypothetical protein
VGGREGGSKEGGSKEDRSKSEEDFRKFVERVLFREILE